MKTRTYVAGHLGMVGSALVRRLARDKTVALILRTRAQLDLRDQGAVETFFASQRPERVYLAAARVGGIAANANYPADFIRDNLMIQTNVIDAAFRNGTRKLLFLGSSCVYPGRAAQPLTEDALLTSALEPTNQWYAVAKIAGLKMCEAYGRQYGFNSLCLMPCNLYGPFDNHAPEHSHVIPALLQRFHEATVQNLKEVVVWGSGTVYREFLHVDDLADAAVFLMNTFEKGGMINVGTGHDLRISELAELIGEVVGYKGKIVYDPSRPDGTFRKVLDTTRLAGTGWEPRIDLKAGLAGTYDWYRAHAFPPPAGNG